MIKKYVFALFAFVLTPFCFSQSFDKIFSYSTTYEYANAGLELSNGNYLVAINNKILCLAPNGDSLWSKTYPYLGDIKKIFRDESNKLMLASTIGKMFFVNIDENNGDTHKSFFSPKQFSNSGYDILDVVVLPSGDYIMVFSNGGGNGSAIQRFTPKSTVLKWSNDYAGQNWKPKTILLEDTSLLIAGYVGVGNFYNLRVSKLSINNKLMWVKTFIRNAYYGDRMLGMQKNSSGNYLIANSWNVNSVLVPAVLVLNPAGDSLMLNTVSNYNGVNINHGMLHSLKPNKNGFYAAGYLNYNGNTPDNKIKSAGYMTVFSISEDGKIEAMKSFNKSGYYLDANSMYSGSESWGTLCFETSDNHYLLLGTGSKLENNKSGIGQEAKFKGYVVKSQVLNSAEINNYKIVPKGVLFPNPANKTLFISISNQSNIATINVFNGNGNKIISRHYKNESEVQLDTELLAPGIYFVEIMDFSGNRLFQKLVVTH